MPLKLKLPIEASIWKASREHPPTNEQSLRSRCSKCHVRDPPSSQSVEKFTGNVNPGLLWSSNEPPLRHFIRMSSSGRAP